MRIGTQKLAPPKPGKVVIFREDENGAPANITFMCGPVLDYTDFEKLSPSPKPPLVTNAKEGSSYHDTSNPGYKARIEKWSDLKVRWLAIQSLRATEGLEWETVKFEDPETWGNYEKELKSFLTEGEFNRVIAAVYDANSPTGNRRQEALDVFTQLQAAGQGTSPSQPGEPTSTPSSDPASV